MANAEHCSQSPMSCQHASRFAEKLLEAHPKHCLMPDAWRVAAMGREAAPQKGTFREWRCAGDIPKSCLVTDGSRCIGANQARKLGAADPMAASEKARQTNLRIGGLTRLAAPGRVPTSARIKFNLRERQVDSVWRRSAPSVFSPANDCCRIAKLTVILKNQ